jgi:hypothetical protein
MFFGLDKHLNQFIWFCLVISTSLFSREQIVLDPNDPAFTWMDELIEKDFSKVRKIALRDFRKAARVYQSPWVGIFQIRNNKVYAKNVSQNALKQDACLGMLKYLCQHYKVPDLMFFYLYRDGIDSTLSEKCPVPMFTGARRNGVNNSILFVDWYFDISNPDIEWNQQINIIDHAEALSWNQKKEVLFWRGSNNDGIRNLSKGVYSIDKWHETLRGKACYLSQKHPDLIDAYFTAIANDVVVSPLEDFLKIISLAPLVTIDNHLDYKYQLQLTGCMANYPRDRWQFYSNCLVFRHECPDEMFWYPLLRPWEHYIPVETDLSDLVEKILWAKNNDPLCEAIAKSGRKFAEEHFMPEHIALYCYKVLVKYASLIEKK